MAFLVEHVIVWEGKDIVGLTILGVFAVLFILGCIFIFIASKIEKIKGNIARKKRLREECEVLRRERNGVKE